MKKRIFLVAFLFFWGVSVQAAPAVLELPFSSAENTSEKITERSLFQTISGIQNAQQVLVEKNIELAQEEDRTFPESAEINELSAQKTEMEFQLEELQKVEEKESETISQKKSNLESINFQLNEKSKIFHENFELHLQNIEKIKKEISDTTEEIAKMKEVAKNQAEKFAIKIGIFLGFLGMIFLLRFISAKTIRKISGKIPLARENTLLRINKIVFNILIALSVLVAVFSQFAAILPFLAILGTAIAFALRNIISSFIAWFLIGTSSGYKIGDLIEVGSVRGRVIEIQPFLTLLRQMGTRGEMRGDTGRIMSIPNKFIFESPIKNFSKMYRFTFLMIDFFLEPASDLDEAKKMLRESIYDVASRDIEEAEKNLPNLQLKFGITAENIEPKIYLEPDPRGILLRGKVICRLNNGFDIRSGITEKFFKKIQQSEGMVKVRFIETAKSFSEE